MSVGDEITAKIGRWTFEGDVTNTFSQHVARSVPLYYEGHDVITRLSDFFIMDGSVCYELGSSNGNLTIKLAQKNSDKKNTMFIGIDEVPSMCKTATKNKENLRNVKFICDDILKYDYEKADLIVSYYTIQFVRPKMRQEIFNTIYNSLNWGGAFILFEKVRASDARFQDIMTTMYLEYKKSKDYTNDEILDKLFSIKGILEPFSSQGNMDLLKRAGFTDIMSIMKYLCFEGFLAIK